MNKVLVDRELLERIVKHLEWDGDGSQTVMQYAQQGDRLAEELAEAIAQPAEAGGVDRWNGLKLAAEVAEEDGPWDPRVGLTDCEAAFAKSASPAVVLELIAALSAVTAERDALVKDAERYRWLAEHQAEEFPDFIVIHEYITDPDAQGCFTTEAYTSKSELDLAIDGAMQQS